MHRGVVTLDINVSQKRGSADKYMPITLLNAEMKTLDTILTKILVWFNWIPHTCAILGRTIQDNLDLLCSTLV